MTNVNTLTHKDPETISFLHNFVRDCSMKQLEKYSRDLKISIKECTLETTLDSYADEISLILLWSGIGSITFKVHFSLPVCMKWASHGLKKDKNSISTSTAQDFMREFCNVMGGFLRGCFEKHNILIGMSLPFLAPGHDEAIFRKLRDPRSQSSLWKLSDGEVEVICSTDICLLEPDLVKAIRPELEKQLSEAASNNDSGEVNFI